MMCCPGDADGFRPGRWTDRPRPPYRYQPGGNEPHPSEHPAGYLHGVADAAEALLTPDRWREQGDYLFGIDLFNEGYYWQAHEAWEGLWHQASGAQRSFLQALILTAAARLQAEIGRAEGARKLCRRANRRLDEMARGAAAERGTPPNRYMGLDLRTLREHLGRLAARPAEHRFFLRLA